MRYGAFSVISKAKPEDSVRVAILSVPDADHEAISVVRRRLRLAMADLYVACGFYHESARLHELKNIRCSFELDGNGAVFTLLWG